MMISRGTRTSTIIPRSRSPRYSIRPLEQPHFSATEIHTRTEASSKLQDEATCSHHYRRLARDPSRSLGSRRSVFLLRQLPMSHTVNPCLYPLQNICRPQDRSHDCPSPPPPHGETSALQDLAARGEMSLGSRGRLGGSSQGQTSGDGSHALYQP
jgi:hypothetical protein